MNSRRKPRVVIPSKFDDLILVFQSIMPNCEEGLVPRLPGDVEPDHAFLRTIFESGPVGFGDGGSDLAVSLNNDAIAAQEASENFYASRDVHLANLTEQLRALRDYFFALESDNLNSLGKYGYTVLQRGSRGDQKPEVVIPTNTSSLIDLGRRVSTVLGTMFSDVEADPNYDAFVAMYVATGNNPTGESMGDSIDGATNDHIQGRSKSEESQNAIARRDVQAEGIRKSLRKIRDYCFAVTSDDFGRVSEIGFEVIQTGSPDPDPDDPYTPEQKGDGYTNIENSSCNDGGTVNNNCVVNTFGADSVEYWLVLEVNEGFDPIPATSSLLDIAAVAGLPPESEGM